MTYFQFLGLFLLLPTAVLLVLDWIARRRGHRLPESFRTVHPAGPIALLAVVAVVYTTPWDNYLVATRVWWYDPQLVCGVTLGWVPLEEYCFFVLQTVMTGTLWVVAARFLAARPDRPLEARGGWGPRIGATAMLAVPWVGAVSALVAAWREATYLALELAWALPPLMVQTAFGADILWKHRRLVTVTIAASTLFLTLCDAVAIGTGTWTIDPRQTLGWKLGGVVPVEELVFFLLTNSLVVCGLTLLLARDSHRRAGFSSR